jgi:hypothetical protein
MSQTLTVRLDPALLVALDNESRRSKRSKGRIVREALDEHLKRSHPNALQAFGKYVGIVKGPRDLSTNKQYLRGFGKTRR